MRLLGIKSTSMARAHELDGVSYGRWPVEALLEGVPYKGPRSSKVATSPRVQILEELSAVLYGDAALQDPCRASSV